MVLYYQALVAYGHSSLHFAMFVPIGSPSIGFLKKTLEPFKCLENREKEVNEEVADEVTNKFDMFGLQKPILTHYLTKRLFIET